MGTIRCPYCHEHIDSAAYQAHHNELRPDGQAPEMRPKVVVLLGDLSSEDRSKPSIQQNAGSPPALQTVAADRCLKCNQETSGARYRFWVARRQTLAPQILHEEKVFICDRCAGARVRFPALIVLLLWVPLLALLALVVGNGVVRSLARVVNMGLGQTRGFQLGLGARLVLVLGLLFLIGVLIRLSWRQFRAVRERQFYLLPYSNSVARLAIHLRRKELLRSLRLSKASALFLTQDNPILPRQYRSGMH